ncbi:DUF2637 domain-containing protein [Streptomyces sp. NPDC051018]|uniref:DUF2637 domain-containing protein n=1 Tax=Streptomyces sp. NPDC051018 TaxID=3365639 RepID=UPI00379FAAEB
MPSATPGTSLIRLGIALLGTVGFALSYDALRRMAAAMHISEPLTYLFPLVIDGFIAIGIGALLILRTAPLRSRLYVWMLVGLATATSIWANALHAVRINQQTRHPGLRLDDLTVGALSAIAPLALAGAVHLYLIVQRRPLAQDERAREHRHGGPATRPGNAPQRHQPTALSADGSGGPPRDTTTPATTDEAPTKPVGRRPSVPDAELTAVVHAMSEKHGGRVSRPAVEKAVREKGFAVSKDRAEEAVRSLQAKQERTEAEAA